MKPRFAPLVIEPADEDEEIDFFDEITLDRNYQNGIDIIQKYIDTFSSTIFVKNPKNEDQISLTNLLQNIFHDLKTKNEYLFDENFTIPKEEIPTLFVLGKSSNKNMKAHSQIINENQIVKGEFLTGKITFFKYEDFKYQNENIFIKQCCLKWPTFLNDFTQSYILVLREICLQYYAYYLNSIRPLNDKEQEYGNIKLTIIPKIYKIDIKPSASDPASKCISIYMEYIQNIETFSNKEEFIREKVIQFELWDSIIKTEFTYFEEHDLFHLDTAHRNIFWTKDDTEDDGIEKIVIIDFGEANLKNFISLENNPQPSGYLKIESNPAFFENWLNKKSIDYTNSIMVDNGGIRNVIFGGRITKKFKSKSKSKTKKSKTKKSKTKSKKSKSKKSKSKTKKAKKSKTKSKSKKSKSKSKKSNI